MTEPNEPKKADIPAGISEKPQPVVPKPAVPKPAPAKPAPTKKGDGDRRVFLLSWFAIAWWSFGLAMLSMVLGTLRFLFPNVLSEPPTQYRAGKVTLYDRGQVTNDYKEKGFWIVRSIAPVGGGRTQDIVYALSTVCTHLGCNPNWLESDKKFKCPCHGSGFYISGINFEGPAPRPLERFAVTKSADGEIIVDKARKFQFERGEWENPESYINV
jgi:cytochrome b6-f complex iron-sulfur subunit